MPDIDIDVQKNSILTKYFPNMIKASMLRNNNELIPHTCGRYFQNIPVDNITNLAAIPYEEAEVLGYQKIDFLNLNMLMKFHSKKEIRELIKNEPDWSLLQREEVVNKLSHIHRHFNIIQQINPCTIQELADCIAIIRPDKIKLLNSYLLDKSAISPLLYRNKNDDKSSFKKGHAIAYAQNIILQLHLYTLGELNG